MDKFCYQQSKPAWQTDCFEAAGGESCSADDCLVEAAYRIDPVVRMYLYDAVTHESLIRCRLFHQICRMSNMSADNAEYWERVPPLVFSNI